MAKSTYTAVTRVKIGGKRYMPESTLELDADEATQLGTAVRKGGSRKAPGGFDVGSATKDELEAEAARRGITVTRADRKEGEPLVSDYIAALK